MVTWLHDTLALKARLGDGELFELGPRLKGKISAYSIGRKESAGFTLHDTARI
jgi:hypothetical protein